MTLTTLAHHLPATESAWRIALHAFDHVVVWVALGIAIAFAARGLARAWRRDDESRPA